MNWGSHTCIQLSYGLRLQAKVYLAHTLLSSNYTFVILFLYLSFTLTHFFMHEMSPATSTSEQKNIIADPFAELERSVHAALETYSNVHRGSGHKSMVTTHLYEQARTITLDYLGLNKYKYLVIFCTQRSAEVLKAKMETESYRIVSSRDIGLPLGVWAVAADKKKLPGGAPLLAGGGTARLVSPGWVIWDSAPDRFEAGTPSIINVIAFARALCMIQQYGKEIFQDPVSEKLSATEILYHDDLEKYSGPELLDRLRNTLIGHSILVPTIEGEKPYINLDNSASTPAFTPVWNAVRQTWRQPQKIQQEMIHEVRSICAEMLGASLTNYDLIFTSNTTEAINMAAGSINPDIEQDIEPVMLSTILEHTSNDLPWRMVPKFSVIRLPVDHEGFLDLDRIDKIFSEYNQKEKYGKKRIKLMAVSGASNVLGSFNNLEAIGHIVHKYGAKLLVDAAQLIAHRKIEMELWGIDYLAFSAHKVYAPFGTGVLAARKGLLNFESGELELIQSSGEANPGGIAALGKALLLMKRIGMDLIQEEEQALTRRALAGLKQINGLVVYGINDPESPRNTQKGGVLVFSMKGMMSNRIAEKLAMHGGIGVRYGCHCAHILVKHILGVSPFLERFQKIIARLFPRLRFPGVARVSFGIENTEEDVDRLINVLTSIAGKPREPKSDAEQYVKNFVRNAAERVYSQIQSG